MSIIAMAIHSILCELGRGIRVDGRGATSVAVPRYAARFGGDAASILAAPFVKLYPKSLRPYGRLYAYWGLVIRICRVSASQVTVAPRASLTKRRGT